MFDQRSEDVVRLVATQAAVAVENARLYAAEQAARRTAELAADRLVLLQEITARLARSTTREEVVRAVIETVVGPLGALRVGVYLLEGDRLRAVDRVQSATPGQPVPQSPQRPELDLAADNLVSACARERRVGAFGSFAEMAERHPVYASSVTGVEAALALPLVTGERTLGVLGLGWREPRSFDQAEVEWLASAAEQLSLALLQVELRASERAAQAALAASASRAISVSQTLQRSLLPPALPVVDALAVAVRYVPGTADAEVGGDWYDVIPTPDDGVVLVIGDVQGHSVNAAAVMGQLRVALNAYLVEGHAPEAAMSRVNRVVETLRTDVIATCCLVALDPATGRARVVRAGHPLPLLSRAGGGVGEVRGDAGIPLGVLPEWDFTATELQLEAGDRLLLFTDGLVEVPGADVTTGVEELMSALAAVSSARTASGDPDPTERRSSRAIRQDGLEDDVDRVLERMGARTTDDVAVLACEYAGPSWSYRRAELRVEGIAEVADARAFTRATLRGWEVEQLEDTVGLLVTEMVTNALVHTGAGATVELRRLQDAVRVLVTDSASRVPQHRAAEDGDTGGRGLLVVGALSREWGVEPSGEGKTVWADVKV